MMAKDKNFAELSERIGHVFKKPDLLRDALTHPSLAGKRRASSPYERLEFLGDRVLGLVIAEWLYELYPNEKEGELAKRHAALVSASALKKIAAAIELDKALLLAHGEEVGANRKNLYVLSDAMEAVIGALYLDSGLGAAAPFIRRFWDVSIRQEKAPVEPKTVLQEWAQGRGLPLPNYKVISRSGPAHAPDFEIELSVKGRKPVTAAGRSKREAEKAAALLMLQEIEKE